MKLKRIFIAINPPARTKAILYSYKDEWLGLPVKWTKEENLHLTLLFLGYLKEEEIPAVIKKIEKISQKEKPFIVQLEEIIYAPPGKKTPRMIWVKGKESSPLNRIFNQLEITLFNKEERVGERGKKIFNPHITLGRIRQWEFKKLEPEERPKIEKKISLNFPAKSIEIEESELKREGPRYTILESCKLGREDILI